MDYKKFVRTGRNKADITPLLGNAEAFGSVVNELYEIFKNTSIDKIACIDANGFFFGTALALKFNVGIVPLRWKGKLQNETHEETFVDYSGTEKTLEIHKDAVGVGEKVLLVDDWLETGETTKAAIKLVEKCGGVVAGIGIFMDDSSETTKKELEKYNYHFVDSGY